MSLQYRFTLSHYSGSQVISEPDGWQDIKVILDRDEEYKSLIELFEVPLIFYGNNGEHDGGMDFIQNILSTYGINENVGLLIEVSEDGYTYDTLCNNRLNLESYKVIDGRKLRCALLRDDMWAKFTNREDTPVNIQSSEDLDGNDVQETQSISVRLTGQKVKQQFVGNYKDGYIVTDPGDNFLNYYFAWDVADRIIDEVHRKYNLFPPLGNPEVPAWIFEPEFAGEYIFDIRIEASSALLAFNQASDMETGGDYYVRWYFKKNNDTPVEFTIDDHLDTFGSTSYTFSDTMNLDVGDRIYVYGFFSIALPGLNSMLIWGLNNDGITVPGGSTEFFYGSAPSGDPNPSRFNITGHTIYPDSDSEGFFIHDLFYAIIRRITSYRAYSEFLGSPFTTTRQYDQDGCGWNHIAQKGLHLRGYSLDEKKMFMSFKELWTGIHPIFNLGLTYDEIEGQQVIRIENKSYFFDTSPSLNLSWVNNIEEGVDKNEIIKKIIIGYNKWQSEEVSGLDDPQTKKTYATLFEVIGRELNILSSWIAASLTIEITRRKTLAKSTDYKFDNDTFIIALNGDTSDSPYLDSPNVFYPELDENFTNIENLLNPETRYNLNLTPLRNFFRWANVTNGCLQSYLTSLYRFVSGEGNYDLVSDYNCATGIKADCDGTVCEEVGEGDDIALEDYGDSLGYLHTPVTLEFEHPLSWTEYQTIRENKTKAIGVSTTDEDHEICFIKRLEYDLHKSRAKFIVWKR